MARPQQEDPAATISSSSMKRSPLTPIIVDGHRTIDDPKLAYSPSHPSVTRSHSDEDLCQPTQSRKHSVQGPFNTRNRRRSHNRRPSPASNSPAIAASLTSIYPIPGRRASLPTHPVNDAISNEVPLHIDNIMPQHRDSISEDLYEDLQSFRFGAPPLHTTHQPANDEEDEDERQRGDRAKMRAIDDGTRRPSLPTNSSTPVLPRSRPSLCSLSSADIVVGERQWDEHSELDWNMHMGDITPTKASPPPPPSSAGGVSTQNTRSTHTEPRRPSVPIAIPVLRRRSRSADELALDFERRMRGSTPTQASLPTSASRFSWSEDRQSSDIRDPSSSPEENAYEGYDLNYILSQNTAGEDSQLKRQASTNLLRGKFRSKTKTAVQSRFEDTFMRHIMDSDPVHKKRQAEWTFRRETTTNSSNGSPKSKDRDKEEIGSWRCEWVGKFDISRIHGESRTNVANSDTSKGSYNRLLIVHSEDPSNQGNTKGGPRVILHRHSRAPAFSIFRAHTLSTSPTHKAMSSTPSVLLATKEVLRDYTRTKSTRTLMTHGLTDDGNPPSNQSRHGSGSSGDSLQERSSRQSSSSSRHHVNTTSDLGTSVNVHDQQRLTASVNSRTANHSSQERTRTISTRNAPQLKESPPSTSSVSASRPASLAFTESSDASNSSSASFGVEHVPSVPQWVSSMPRSPRPSTSHAKAFAMIDPDTREQDSYHHRNDSGPLSSFSTTRVVHPHTASLPPPATPSPPHTQKSTFGLFKGVFRSKHPQKEPASPVTDDGEDEPKTIVQEGKFSPPWLTTARRSEREEHERMIQTLNSSFESVGLIPPKKTKPRPHKGNGKGEESVLDDVPDDSMCMLLPLWPEETDSETQGNQSRHHSLSRHSGRAANHPTTHSSGHASATTPAIPLGERKFLLVYYCHQLKDEPATDSGGNNKKRRRPQTAGERPQHTQYVRASAAPGPFFAAGRLLTYDNVRSSGVRLPNKGLSISGSIEEAVKAVPVPSPITSNSDGFEVIAFCQGKGNGVSLIHEGLVKLGLVDPEDDDENAKLSEVGRAIVEMVWCGCISLLSVMP